MTTWGNLSFYQGRSRTEELSSKLLKDTDAEWKSKLHFKLKQTRPAVVTNLPEPVCFLCSLFGSQDRLVHNLLQGCSDRTHHLQRDRMCNAVKTGLFWFVRSPSLRYGSRTSRLPTLYFNERQQIDWDANQSFSHRLHQVLSPVVLTRSWCSVVLVQSAQVEPNTCERRIKRETGADLLYFTYKLKCLQERAGEFGSVDQRGVPENLLPACETPFLLRQQLSKRLWLRRYTSHNINGLSTLCSAWFSLFC